MRKALALLGRLEGFLLSILLVAMSFLYTLNVLVRNLVPSYASHIAWIDEVCLFGLAWIVFLGLGLGLEHARHIGMTTLLRSFAPDLLRGIKFVIDLVGLAFSLYIAQLCFEVTLLVLKSGQVSPTLDVSMSWLYGPMPLGFLLLGLRYALELAGVNDRLAAEPDPTLSV